jgi:oxygen-independent coproporphyrinogen III oxidase
MAGIYLHVPFCRKKCFYCDFYKTTETDLRKQYLNSLLKEMESSVGYLKGEEIETIYFGGGTPSVLDQKEIGTVLLKIRQLFNISKTPEITFEANPDDITASYLSALKNLGINRLSIGIQSFDDNHLKMMNRRHDGSQAERALDLCSSGEFDNISADLIFAVPGMTNDQLIKNLEILNHYPVNHLSVYYLTIHKGTGFFKQIAAGSLKEMNDEAGIEQFGVLLDYMEEKGFEHYEISNFARNGNYSKHNSNYWSGIPYLGLGPAAHSFNRESRQWNVSDLKKYIHGTETGNPFLKREYLSPEDKYNEYVMTSLRTKWGVNIQEIKKNHGDQFFSYFMKTVNEFINNGFVTGRGSHFFLTRSGIFISDKIISSMFLI